MASIFGGIGTAHTPAIDHAFDKTFDKTNAQPGLVARRRGACWPRYTIAGRVPLPHMASPRKRDATAR